MNGLKTDTIINRDALYALRELPSESVHCAVTSPPYYALRDFPSFSPLLILQFEASKMALVINEFNMIGAVKDKKTIS